MLRHEDPIEDLISSPLDSLVVCVEVSDNFSYYERVLRTRVCLSQDGIEFNFVSQIFKSIFQSWGIFLIFDLPPDAQKNRD